MEERSDRLTGLGYLTVSDVAKRLKVHPRTVRKMIADGEIPPEKVDRFRSVTRIHESWFAERLESRKTA